MGPVRHGPARVRGGLAAREHRFALRKLPLLGAGATGSGVTHALVIHGGPPDAIDRRVELTYPLSATDRTPRLTGTCAAAFSGATTGVDPAESRAHEPLRQSLGTRRLSSAAMKRSPTHQRRRPNAWRARSLPEHAAPGILIRRR